MKNLSLLTSRSNEEKKMEEGDYIMYTRGQLALIGNIGRKAIRIYEQEGLIISSKVDENNGYHYYDDTQIERLKKIKEYKRLGFSIADIKGILCEGIQEEEIIAEKKSQLDQSIEEMQALRKKLDEVSQEERKEENQEIDERCFGEHYCITIKENIELEKLGASVGKLYEKASKEQLTVVGSHFIKYEGIFESDIEFKMTTCLPIKQEEWSKIEEECVCVEKGKRCLHMNFRGGFSKIGNAHIQLEKYMKEKNILGTGVVYEDYNRDMSVDIYYELMS